MSVWWWWFISIPLNVYPLLFWDLRIHHNHICHHYHLIMLSKPHQGGLLTGGNMLVSHRHNHRHHHHRHLPWSLSFPFLGCCHWKAILLPFACNNVHIDDHHVILKIVMGLLLYTINPLSKEKAPHWPRFGPVEDTEGCFDASLGVAENFSNCVLDQSGRDHLAPATIINHHPLLI